MRLSFFLRTDLSFFSVLYMCTNPPYLKFIHYELTAAVLKCVYMHRRYNKLPVRVHMHIEEYID